MSQWFYLTAKCMWIPLSWHEMEILSIIDLIVRDSSMHVFNFFFTTFFIKMSWLELLMTDNICINPALPYIWPKAQLKQLDWTPFCIYLFNVSFRNLYQHFAKLLKHTFTYNSQQFLTEMDTRGSRMPTTFISFITNLWLWK